jgi:arabinan endo-1,5-alpha-L-arabinosidase
VSSIRTAVERVDALRRQAVFLAAVVLLGARARAQTGDVAPVHDPCIARCGDLFYVFNTGRGAPTRTSPDLFTWHRGPRALPAPPDWTRTYNPAGDSLWAPDVSFANGRWYLYYAVSTFGSRRSAIGLATNATLDPNAPTYRWVDAGPVVTTAPADHWNAIDPCATTDADGRRWLVCGSCWSGIKIFPLDGDTGLAARGAGPIALAAHPPDNIIEEGYVRRHGTNCYLWVSVGHCCRGAASDYRILVGRSATITGPYRDRDGRPMLDGGGTLVLASDGPTRGPGSCAIAELAGHDYLVHHMYDANRRGVPTLQVRPLAWDTDGWPLAGEPITRPPGTAVVARAPEGHWTVTTDFRQPTRIKLAADGTVRPAGTWKLKGSTLTVQTTGGAGPTACVYADDGDGFVGRDRDGGQLRGVRVP